MEMIDYNAIPAYLESTELTFELESVGIYENIMFPVSAKEISPQVEVQYNLEEERNTQKSVDKGHSPWRLDPVATAQVFVSLKISPGGIEGEYPIESENLKLLHSDHEVAIVEVDDPDTNIHTVYLKRLIRQDETGIWTVVGYDENRK
ncbi:hypothetical protein P4476_10035 [Ureibacillus terrenus]|uniref:hypothetical protein n=1 Tax=Ureibacillus terrenus TaxID=118246 RepID=UPI002E20F06D|nr:hypothetical protein [Ureibacillus terrenus]